MVVASCLFRTNGRGQNQDVFYEYAPVSSRAPSTIAFDPKGELYEQTAMDYRTFYRLDLINPAQATAGILCRNAELALFSPFHCWMMLSLEARAKTNQDPFWGNAEQVLLTAVLLHLAECYQEALHGIRLRFCC